MSKDFFDKPFDEDTIIKLQLYKEYVRKWAPVFLATQKPFVYTINIFDFFSGTGCDSEGTPGSPIIAINALMEYAKDLGRPGFSINLYFNDYNEAYCKRLRQNIEKTNFNKNHIKIQILNMDFREAYEKLKPKMKNSANLIFLDQFGVKYVDKPFFQELTSIKTTDIIFFVSSSTFKRFVTDENVRSVLELDVAMVRDTPGTHIHKMVSEQYKSFVPQNCTYFLAPFSIKKGSNIYGLIFGSRHPLGMEKFLEVCWEEDTLTGQANFDIEGLRIDHATPFLFDQMNVPNKIQQFEKELEDLILSKELRSDKDIYYFMINNGFLGKHVKPVLKKLNNKITLKHPSFKYDTLHKKGRDPRPIIFI